MNEKASMCTLWYGCHKLVKSVVIVMYIVQTANTGKIVRLLQRPESLPCLCNGKGTGRIKFLQAIWSIPVLLPIF